MPTVYLHAIDNGSYLLGASTDADAWHSRYWHPAGPCEDECLITSVTIDNPEVIECLISHGTSDQWYADGYEAIAAALAAEAAAIRTRIIDEYGWDATTESYGPGKFEGEPIYAPYFYEHSMEGFGESHYAECAECAEWECAECEGECDHVGPDYCDHETEWEGGVIELDAIDYRVFPEIDPGARFALVYVSDSGFVYVSLW